MPFDAHKNLAISQVEIPPVPADSGTQLQVVAGQGVRFPAPPFDVTIWLASEYPNPANAEVARCTAVSGDILFLDRAQGGTTARAVQLGDLIAQSVGDRYLLSLESGTNFPQIVTGSVTAPLGQFGSLGTTPLDPAFIIAPIPDAKLSVNVLTHPGGYPGDPTLFLNADGVFAVPAGGGGGVPLHAPTHAEGGTDPVQLTQSQVTGLTTSLTTIAGDITTLEGDVTTLQTIVTSGPVAAHASTHEVGGADPIDGALQLSALGVGVAPGGAGSVNAQGIIFGDEVRGNYIKALQFLAFGFDATLLRGSTPGVLKLSNGTETDFSRLQFGGTTSGFPALKRNGGGLDVILADGSDFTHLVAGVLYTQRGILKLGFGEHSVQNGAGTPEGTLALPVGSLYLRTDGGTSTTLYVKETGAATSTGWVAHGAGGGGGAPALHAITHTPGNTDPIPNVAWVNVANTFTALQTINNADLSFAGTGKMRFGGAVSGDPMIKRNSAIIEARNGTDTAFATFRAAFTAGDVTSGSLPFARIQLTASPRLLGRGTAAAGAMEEITLGTGLTMTGTVLSSSGGAGADEVSVGATDPGATYELWYDTAAVSPTNNYALTNVANTFTPNQTFAGEIIVGVAPNSGSIHPPGDNQSLYLQGGTTGNAGGASLNLIGATSAFGGGRAILAAGNGGIGTIEFSTGGLSRGRMHPSGGFSWGSTTDPGAGNLSVSGDIVAGRTIRPNTTTGANTKLVTLTGGHDASGSGGSYVNVFGNEYVGYSGGLDLVATGSMGLTLLASHAGGVIRLMTAGIQRGQIHASGGFSWGSTIDPGAGAMLVGEGPFAAGGNFTEVRNGLITLGKAGTGATAVMTFFNANGAVGTISTSGTMTGFNTTSDARLKTDRGRHTDPDVLRKTVIHNFDWIAGGLPGRGVFAQEAVEVAPFAVSVGGDEVDGHGLLLQPWGVDYSKYVPDLITGWQHHNAIIEALVARITALEARLA